MNAKSTRLFFFAISITFHSSLCFAKTWKVGPGRTYTLPSQVAGLVSDGDVVEIDAAEYTDCATWNANNLTIKGVGGKPHFKNKVCAGKGIWNLNGLNTTIENIEFSGATNPDQNGSGIRGVGGGFSVRNCYFHNNDNGILASPSGPLNSGQGDVLVEYCEFFQNGFGDGQSHNLYIGNFLNFTLQYCYVHSAKVGHEVKSRAYNNYILYNKISDQSSDASRSIDLPNGGNSIIIGNVIEQGPYSANSNIIGYGLEGFSNSGSNNLILVNNTLVNNRTNGGSFVMVNSGTGMLKLVNNIFAGNGTLVTGDLSTLDSANNLIRKNIAQAGFKNAAGLDYELTATSPAIDNGKNPGSFGVYGLSPVSEYVNTAGKRDRSVYGNLDVGSYEFQLIQLSQLDATARKVNPYYYPNPFHDTFTLNSSSGIQKVIVSDVHGIEVIKLLNLPVDMEFEIGKELPIGTYIVSVYFSSGDSEVKRIVKLK